MYLKLPFKILGYRYEKAVFIVLNIGVLEDICTEAKIEFHQMQKYFQDNPDKYFVMLLYYGYLAGCKQLRKKPHYKMAHARYWAVYITAMEQAKLYIMIQELYGKFSKGNKKKV